MNKKYYIYEMNITTLNIVTFLILLVITPISYYLYPKAFYLNENINLVLCIIIYFVYMFLHEIFHSIAYVIYGGKYKNVTYGINLEKGVLCCLCKQDVDKKNILHSLMYPLVFLGIVTFIIALIFKLPALYILSILNISGCSGDIIMFFFMKKLDNNIKFSEYDNPIGFGIYTDKDISKNKYFGLKFIECKDKLERNDFRKFTISRASIVIIILMIILAIIVS